MRHTTAHLVLERCQTCEITAPRVHEVAGRDRLVAVNAYPDACIIIHHCWLAVQLPPTFRTACQAMCGERTSHGTLLPLKIKHGRAPRCNHLSGPSRRSTMAGGEGGWQPGPSACASSWIIGCMNDPLAPASSLLGQLQRGRGAGFLTALAADPTVVAPLLLDCILRDPRWVCWPLWSSEPCSTCCVVLILISSRVP